MTPPQPNPASLYGNPARLYVYYPAVPAPLDLDALIAAGLPSVFVPPFILPAGPQDMAEQFCNIQAWVDFTGIVAKLVGWTLSGNKTDPPTYNLQQWANFAGEPFIYKGVTYAPNGVWMP